MTNASALLDRPTATTAAPVRHLRPLPQVAEQPREAAPAPAAPRPSAAPRGFALYVGLDELKAAADGVSLPVLV